MKIRKPLVETVQQVEELANEYVDIAEQPIEDKDVDEQTQVDPEVTESIDMDDPNDRKALSQLARELVSGIIEDAKKDKQVATALGDAVDVEDNSVSDEVADAAEEVAEQTWKAEDLIPGSEAAVGLHNAAGALNAALLTAIDNQESGIDSDYPNVLLSGLAGFGKTAAVRAFCKEHHLNLFECDAKSLDISTVGGIPYPKQDKNGELKQMPIASSFWDRLSLPNTVLFLDEFNRAQDNVAGTLLDLINGHNLPITTKTKSGKYSTIKHFDNILFTVIAINPASRIFPNVNEYTPEKVSRSILMYDVKPDANELLTHMKKVYNAVLANPLLSDKLLRKYEGQLNIAEALLTNSEFKFDDVDDVEKIHTDNNETGSMTQFLNYRTLTGAILACNGTKLDFLARQFYYKFSKTKQTMIKNILSSYSDKPTKGNSVFTKAQQQAASLASAAAKTNAAVATKTVLSSFSDSLDNDDDL